MENKNSDLPEGLRQLIEGIKKAAEAIGLLDNPNLKDLLVSKKFKDSIDNYIPNFLFPLLIISINTKMYDDIFQTILENPRITFFHELKDLIKETYKKDKKKANKMISAFLKIPVINSFNPSDTRRPTSTMIMDEEMLHFREYFEDKELDFNTIQEFIKSVFLSVDERTEKLLKIPRRFKLEAEHFVNQIKNHYETNRYILGLVLALFDILEGNFNEDLSRYFSMENSPHRLYYPPRRRYGTRSWLKDYLVNNTKYSKKFTSLRYIFEDWIFKELRDMRIHKAHWEIDIFQDQLHEGKYKIEIGGVLKELTLEEIDENERAIFKFILWTKHLVARQYYPNNEELINYLIK